MRDYKLKLRNLHVSHTLGCTFFFTLNPYPRPSTASVFVKIILSSSKWTGVSLKTYRQNWEETVPGEEKVNQLLNTNCNKCHFNRFMKHVEKSIFQLYPQKVTL
jgi:hypothetical protein